MVKPAACIGPSGRRVRADDALLAAVTAWAEARLRSAVGARVEHGALRAAFVAETGLAASAAALSLRLRALQVASKKCGGRRWWYHVAWQPVGGGGAVEAA
jgi:hypothetical protein